MATDSERLIVQMSADIRALENAMRKAEAATDTTAGKIERSFDRMNSRLGSNFNQLGDTLRTALAAVAVGAIAKDLTKLADSYTSITNGLKNFADVLGDTNAAQQRLVNLAVDSSAPLEATSRIIISASAAARSLGKSADDVFNFAEAVGKGFGIQNSGAAAVEGAITQLSQSIAAPVVQLGEFNSVVDASNRLTQAFADGITEAGGSVARLRQLIGQGKISGADLIEGLNSQLPILREEFARADLTIANAFTNLQTKITAYVGETNQAAGATRTLVPIINLVANNVELLAQAALVLAGVLGAAVLGNAVSVTAAFLTTLARGAVTATAATGAMTIQLRLMNAAAVTGAVGVAALNRALAFFGGPIGFSVVAVGSAMAFLARETSLARIAAEEKERVQKRFAPLLDGVRATTDKLADAEGAYAERLVETRQELFRTALAEASLQRARLQRALAAAEEARRTTPVAGPVGEPGARSAAAGAAIARQVVADQELAAARTAVREAQRQVDEINKVINDSAKITAAPPAAPPPAVPAGGVARATGADAASDAAKKFAEELDEISRVIADARRQQTSDAEGFLDRLPDSARRARAELAQLKALLDAGVFAALGEEQGAARAQVQILEEIAAVTGETAEALAELAKINDLTAEQAEAPARRIRDAAREGRAARDEELGRIFRTGELEQDLKGALRDAFRTGDYVEIFGDRIADALERASDRALDRATDSLIDLIVRSIGGSVGGGSGGKSGGGGVVGSILKGVGSIIGTIFGGPRATGGPILPGKAYLTGENGPELVIPRTPQFVLPNAFTQAMQSPQRPAVLTNRTELNIAYTIDLAGANGDDTIRAIARQESRRGVAEGLRIANQNAPGRNARFTKLGS